MSLFTELTDAVLEQDPNLSLECFLSARRYIQVRWRALHGTPMPEDALTLFLTDPSRGDLTEEQGRRLGSAAVQPDAAGGRGP